MAKIDRIKVRKAFDRGACRYEETVRVQKLVVKKIIADLSQLSSLFPPDRILDIGAGTGMLLRSLRETYPEAFLAGLDLASGMASEALGSMRAQDDFLYVQGDAEEIPFADGTFDLVVSTSTYQWLSELGPAFREVERVLVSGGTFLFALFGDGTLSELKSSYQRALIHESSNAAGNRSQQFFSRDEVLRILVELGFHDVAAENCTEKEYYPDVAAFLRSLKGIGAGTSAFLPATGLGGRRIIRKMMELYQLEYTEKNGIPVSYEVIYGRGRKI